MFHGSEAVNIPRHFVETGGNIRSARNPPPFRLSRPAIADRDSTADSKLANISTREFVEGGDNVMIGGFIAGNQNGPTKVVVRAIGPSLSDKGVPNPLQDPFLELHDGNGNTFATNDNWQDDPGATEIQSKQLAPNDPRESATLQTLAPGAYTAIVRGIDNTIGVALVEVYNVR